MSSTDLKNYDIAFIGSGISCTAVLLNLLNKIQNDISPSKPVKIAIIEKEKELWKGAPYGDRSSYNSLTITTFGEFVPPTEKDEFVAWLIQNRPQWTRRLTESGGQTAEIWIENNREQMDQGNWDDIYIPRHLFGDYLQQKISAIIDYAEQNNLATIVPIQGEVIDVSHTHDYEILIDCHNGELCRIRSKKTILAIGSPPVKSINNLAGTDCKYTYINDTYAPSLEENMKAIESVLASDIPNSEKNILVLGSNASSLELLYLVNTNKKIRDGINKIVVISYSGILPHRITNNDQHYEFEGLSELKKHKKFNSSTLIATIEEDLKIAYNKGVNIGDMYYQLSDLVVELLNVLDDNQKKIFYCAYGMRFSKLIRRSGAEYSNAAAELKRDGKLEMIAGSFVRLEQSKKAGDLVQVVYNNGKNEVSTSARSFPAVVNCGGFEELNFSSSKLIANLIEKGICDINCTNKGFEVNEDFETKKNFHVIGPLLGGIFNSKVRLWHVENAKSIFNISNLLVQSIAKTLLVELSIILFLR